MVLWCTRSCLYIMVLQWLVIVVYGWLLAQYKMLVGLGAVVGVSECLPATAHFLHVFHGELSLGLTHHAAAQPYHVLRTCIRYPYIYELVQIS